MNTYFIIISIFFFGAVVSRDEGDSVGTVLFTEADNYRKCWSDEQLAILTSRMYFENLLPDEDNFNIENDKFITALIDYFRLAVDSVKRSIEGKTKQIILNSLVDSIGGYLHHIALPLARHAYYCGNVDYESVSKLHNTYEEVKDFLRTNGDNWAKPICEFSKYKNKIIPIHAFTEAVGEKPCDELIFEDNQDIRNLISIPIPFFDNCVDPETIAVPLKRSTLTDLQDKEAAFLLVKYFSLATSCLAHRKASKEAVASFYSKMNDFLKNQVFPHLHDNVFYSAFGGVYRIQKSIEILQGINDVRVSRDEEYKHPQEKKSADLKDSLFYNRLKHEGSVNQTKEKLALVAIAPYDLSKSKSMTIVSIFLSILLVWLLIGIIFSFCRYFGTDCKKIIDFCTGDNLFGSKCACPSAPATSKPSSHSKIETSLDEAMQILNELKQNHTTPSASVGPSEDPKDKPEPKSMKNREISCGPVYNLECVHHKKRSKSKKSKCKSKCCKSKKTKSKKQLQLHCRKMYPSPKEESCHDRPGINDALAAEYLLCTTSPDPSEIDDVCIASDTSSSSSMSDTVIFECRQLSRKKSSSSRKSRGRERKTR